MEWLCRPLHYMDWHIDVQLNNEVLRVACSRLKCIQTCKLKWFSILYNKSWPYMDQTLSGSTGTGRISIHVWPLWLNRSRFINWYPVGIFLLNQLHRQYTAVLICVFRWHESLLLVKTANVLIGESGPFFFVQDAGWTKKNEPLYGQL